MGFTRQNFTEILAKTKCLTFLLNCRNNVSNANVSCEIGIKLLKTFAAYLVDFRLV